MPCRRSLAAPWLFALGALAASLGSNDEAGLMQMQQSDAESDAANNKADLGFGMLGLAGIMAKMKNSGSENETRLANAISESFDKLSAHTEYWNKKMETIRLQRENATRVQRAMKQDAEAKVAAARARIKAEAEEHRLKAQKAKQNSAEERAKLRPEMRRRAATGDVEAKAWIAADAKASRDARAAKVAQDARDREAAKKAQEAKDRDARIAAAQKTSQAEAARAPKASKASGRPSGAPKPAPQKRR